MTQEELIKYNRICAEFMGMQDYSKNNKHFEKGIYFCYPDKDKNPGCGYYTILQKTSEGYTGIFSSDWNLIMEADKLRRLRTTRVDFLDFLLTSDVNLIDNDLDKIVEYGNK